METYTKRMDALLEQHTFERWERGLETAQITRERSPRLGNLRTILEREDGNTSQANNTTAADDAELSRFFNSFDGEWAAKYKASLKRKKEPTSDKSAYNSLANMQRRHAMRSGLLSPEQRKKNREGLRRALSELRTFTDGSAFAREQLLCGHSYSDGDSEDSEDYESDCSSTDYSSTDGEVEHYGQVIGRDTIIPLSGGVLVMFLVIVEMLVLM